MEKVLLIEISNHKIFYSIGTVSLRCLTLVYQLKTKVMTEMEFSTPDLELKAINLHKWNKANTLEYKLIYSQLE